MQWSEGGGRWGRWVGRRHLAAVWLAREGCSHRLLSLCMHAVRHLCCVFHPTSCSLFHPTPVKPSPPPRRMHPSPARAWHLMATSISPLACSPISAVSTLNALSAKMGARSSCSRGDVQGRRSGRASTVCRKRPALLGW